MSERWTANLSGTDAAGGGRVAIISPSAWSSGVTAVRKALSGHSILVHSLKCDTINAEINERVDMYVVTDLESEAEYIDGINLIKSVSRSKRLIAALSDRVSAEISLLGAGADAVIDHSIISTELLHARISALLRRSRSAQAGWTEQYGAFSFHTASKTISFSNRIYNLTPKEFGVAITFFRNVGSLLSRQQLLNAVWGPVHNASSRTLDIHVSKIRTKLQLGRKQEFVLLPIYGHGYKLERNLDF
jgi:two-component system OmpR family response regulator